MAETKTDKKSVKASWEEMSNSRSGLIKRCEQYATWTLPYLFTKETDTVEQTELPVAYGSIGARCVNHLSNVINEVLFPVARNFFRIRPSTELKNQAAAAGVQPVQVDNSLSAAEQAALEAVSVAELRSAHVEATKLAIVTGNALLWYPTPAEGESRTCIVYSLRDYVCQRDRLGNVLHIITQDKMVFAALPQDVQAQTRDKFKDEDTVVLYTQAKWNNDMQKYEVFQAVNEIDLVPMKGIQPTYAKGMLPWIPITWHRKRTESYGRGLVEDYAYTFNAYNSLSRSLVLFAAIASDIKRCIDTGSGLDVETVNSSQPGQWLAAKKDELWSPIMANTLDMSAVAQSVQKLEQMLAQAFMLAGASIRDAERVTQEEVRMLARELEKSHGGIYSKFAAEWQQKLAALMMADIGLQANAHVKIQIITGVDALSRNAEIENLYVVVQDLMTVGQLPPQIMRLIDEQGLISYISANRNVKPGTFFKAPAQVQADDATLQEQANANMDREAASKLAASAAQGV